MEGFKKNPESSPPETRREFLRKGLAAALLAAAPDAFAQSGRTVLRGPEKQIQAPRNLKTILTEQLRKDGTVTLTPSVIDEVRDFHEHEYSSPVGARLLRAVFERLNAQTEDGGTYLDRLRDIYAAAGVPEWCLYNVIIESEFKPHALGKGARPDAGAFQFSEEMGRKLGLIKEEGGKIVDSRFNPLTSASAAAKMLKESYGRNTKAGCTESVAWALAMHQYNGGHATDYLTLPKDKKAFRSYSAFITHLWGFMVHKLDAPIEHRQGKEDTLLSLLTKYGFDAREFVKANHQHLVRQPDGSVALKPYEDGKKYTLNIPPLSHEVYKTNPEYALARLGHIPTNAMYLPKLQGLLRVLHSQGIVKEVPAEV